MNSFELNKIIAAVLLTTLIVIGINKFGDSVFHVKKPTQSAYKIEGVELASTIGTTVEVKELVQLDKQIASVFLRERLCLQIY